MVMTLLTSALMFLATCPESAEGSAKGDQSMNQPIGSSRLQENPHTSGPVDEVGPTIIFATYAETDEELHHALYLAESIRAYAGRYRNAPIWVYMAETFAPTDAQVTKTLEELGVEIKTSRAPEASRHFYFAGKTFASGLAEAVAEKKASLLVWMDEDTIILQEPDAFALPDRIGLAYRPVMHNRSGTLYGRPPNEFWRRIYDQLDIDGSLLFPMVTPADQQTINAYFNAGLLVVRPEQGILRAWGESFEVLYEDSVLAGMCDDDITNKIFLHQTALVGAVLHTLKKHEMLELSKQYNYPIFFHQQFDATAAFESIENVVTLRYDIYFRNPDPEWASKLKGDPQKIAWLKERLGREK